MLLINQISKETYNCEKWNTLKNFKEAKGCIFIDICEDQKGTLYCVVLKKEKPQKANTIHYIKLSNQFLNITKHGGKMEGCTSISSSPYFNKQCLKNRTIKDSICNKCFSFQQLERYGLTYRQALEKNAYLLNRGILPDYMLPRFNAQFVRLEAFGDLASVTQVINYFNICNVNQHTNFTLWTKNPHFIQEAMEQGHEKPKNLIVVRSSLFINRVLNYEVATSKYEFIDKIFTVFDKAYIKKNNIEKNCMKKCNLCKKCYDPDNKEIYINEELK